MFLSKKIFLNLCRLCLLVNGIDLKKKRKKGGRGLSTERIDVYYYPEKGIRLRSIKNLEKYCEKKNIEFNRTDFNFTARYEIQVHHIVKKVYLKIYQHYIFNCLMSNPRVKARLIVLGFRQQPGLDCNTSQQ